MFYVWFTRYNKSTCPLNLEAKHPDPLKHPLAIATEVEQPSAEKRSAEKPSIEKLQEPTPTDLDTLVANHTIYNVQPRYLYHGRQFPLIDILPEHNTFFANRPNKAFALREPTNMPSGGTPGVYRFAVVRPIPRVILLDTQTFECVANDPSVCKESNRNGRPCCRGGKRNGDNCTESIECSAHGDMTIFNQFKSMSRPYFQTGKQCHLYRITWQKRCVNRI